MPFDLEERTTKFSEEIVRFLKTIPRNFITIPIASQLIRSTTSIGANYCEADNAVSKNDFINKIGIVKKEAKETVYWLKILAVALPDDIKKIDELKQEAIELHLVFNSIFQKTRKNLENEQDPYLKE